MGEWKKGSSWRSSRGHSRPPKQWKPPLHPGSVNANMPWEKKFLISILPIPYEELSYAMRTMSMYKNVLEWDDSAALEAFHNAKSRFWANINGLPCDIPLPDPDMYIDQVDHNAVIDPELVEDLYKAPPAPTSLDINETDGSDSSFLNKPIQPTGWDDDDDDRVPKYDPAALPSSSNWDIHLEKPIEATGGIDTAEPNPTPVFGAIAEPQYSGWDVNGELWDNGGGNKWHRDDGWGNGYVQDDQWVNKRDNQWKNSVDKSWQPYESSRNGSGRRYNRKRDRGGRFGSRQTNSRSQLDDHQANNSLRNCRGRNNRNHPGEQARYARQPTARHWNPTGACGPMNNRASTEAGSAWQWGRSVS